EPRAGPGGRARSRDRPHCRGRRPQPHLFALPASCGTLKGAIMTDPLQIMADLKPAGLDQMTQEAYERRRAIDLARAFADAAGGGPRGPLARRRRVPGWPLLTGGGVLGAAAAVTAIALTGALTGPPASPVHPGSGTEATSGSPVLDARTFLLASADIA